MKQSVSLAVVVIVIVVVLAIAGIFYMKSGNGGLDAKAKEVGAKMLMKSTPTTAPGAPVHK
jgi:hypothetical protein